MRFNNVLVSLATIISVVTASPLADQVTKASSTTSTIHSTTTKTTTSAQSTPTHFRAIARDSGTKYDGRPLLGTDQSLSNITFGSLTADVDPSYNLYLSGFNQNPTLNSHDGYQLFAGYNCGDQQLCSYDGDAAFLVFGGAEFPSYQYVEVLCTVVKKSDGKLYLACSAEASDKKVKYRKAVVSHDDGHVLLLPAGVAAPKGYSFVRMEVQKL